MIDANPLGNFEPENQEKEDFHNFLGNFGPEKEKTLDRSDRSSENCSIKRFGECLLKRCAKDFSRHLSLSLLFAFLEVSSLASPFKCAQVVHFSLIILPKQIMTSYNSNSDLEIAPLSSNLELALYGELVYSIIAMIANLATFYHIKKTYDEKKAPFRILKAECILTCISQFGIVGVIGGRLSETSHGILCISSTSIIVQNHPGIFGTARIFSSRIK